MVKQDILKQLIVQAWEADLPGLVNRDIPLELLDDTRILSIVGPRRAGKTYACFQLMTQCYQKYPKSNVFYLNLEDERLYPLNKTILQDVWDAYVQVIQPNLALPIIVILDEVQNVPNWSRWVRRMSDQWPQLKLVLTGSSSKLLSREMATELRGRAISIEMFPLSFAEFLSVKGISWDSKIAFSKEKITVLREFDVFFKRGGFPAVVSTSRPEIVLQEYYKAMFARDLVERFSIKNVLQFEDFLRLQLQQFSAQTSISNMEKILSEIGYSLSKNTLSNYLRYAQDAYLLFTVPIYSHRIKNQLRYPKKLYVIDQGLLQAVRFSTSEDWGRILENMVYLALRRKTPDVYYYKDSKCECDFLVKTKNLITQAIQVSYSLSNPKTKEREIRGVIRAMGDHPHAEGLILTYDETDEIHVDGKHIVVKPVWQWMLGV